MKSQSRTAMTSRFPHSLLTQARASCAAGESLNALVVAAVEREVQRRHGLAAYEDILRIREQILARTGPQPDSTLLIRQFRDGGETY